MDAAIVEWSYGLELPSVVLLAVTHVATKGGLRLLAGVGFAVFGRGATRRTGLALLTGLLAHVLLLEGLLKRAVARPRPCVTLGLTIRDTVVDASTYSFPSGHSAASFLGAWVIGVRFPRWRIPLLTLAGLVAVSRDALGAHYPADVAAGAVFGVMLGIFMARIFGLDVSNGAGIEDAPPEPPDGQVPDGAVCLDRLLEVRPETPAAPVTVWMRGAVRSTHRALAGRLPHLPGSETRRSRLSWQARHPTHQDASGAHRGSRPHL